MTGTTLTQLAMAVGGTVRLEPSTEPTPGDSTRADIVDLTHDSRQAQPGWAFACVPGEQHDGHDFAAQAVRQGAAALLVERELDIAVPQIQVASVRAALAPAAAAVHDHPSRKLTTVGVTGTAGKTTVTHAIADILNWAGRSCSVLGTLSGARTTPEATDLQRWLAQRAEEGDDAVAIEVSSHALELGRADQVEFAAGVFTNLTPEHLDFHGDMESYYLAKRRLFDGRSAVAVINRDDAYGRRLIDERSETQATVTFGHEDLDDPAVTTAGSRFGWRGHEVRSRLVGSFNLLNLAAAGATAAAIGLSESEVAAGMTRVAPVRGRMELVAVDGADISVVVDYSHKPDALRVALEAMRELAEGRLWVVFGAGGDRDTAKRPLMGEAAASLADHVVVTSDNPRTEDPSRIIGEIVAGISEGGGSTLDVVEARDDAIALAIEQAEAGDAVLVAGKGHEVTQTIGDRVVHFDDVEVAAGHLGRRARRLDRDA